jgi:hypothetical protein
MTTPEAGPEDLLGQARAGDNAALGELLERHRATWPGSRSTVASAAIRIPPTSSRKRSWRPTGRSRGQNEAEVAGWLPAILAHPASLGNRRGR